MNVYDYIKELKRKGLFKVKYSIVVENIILYVNNSCVYRVIFQVNPDMLKKAKKLGLNSSYVKCDIQSEKIKLEDKYKNGRIIIMYDITKDKADVYEGEISEEEQKNRLKSK